MKLSAILLGLVFLSPFAFGAGAPYQTWTAGNCYDVLPCTEFVDANPDTGDFRLVEAVQGNGAGFVMASVAVTFPIPQGATRVVADGNISWTVATAAMTPAPLSGGASADAFLEVREPGCGDPVPPDCPLGYDWYTFVKTAGAAARTPPGSHHFHIVVDAPDGGFRGGEGSAFFWIFAMAFASPGSGASMLEGTVTDITASAA